MEIIQEVKYDETMKTTVEPYLKQRCISGYTDSYDAVGKLHVLRYQADMPKVCRCDLSWIYGILSEI